ncbi:unnamed protein product, partial [marine sediment metagenome]
IKKRGKGWFYRATQQFLTAIIIKAGSLGQETRKKHDTLKTVRSIWKAVYHDINGQLMDLRIVLDDYRVGTPNNDIIEKHANKIMAKSYIY